VPGVSYPKFGDRVFTDPRSQPIQLTYYVFTVPHLPWNPHVPYKVHSCSLASTKAPLI